MISVITALIFVLLSPLPYAIQGPVSNRKPVVTISLIAINTAIFLATHLGSSGELNAALSYDRFGVLPVYLRPYTLFTYSFIHISFAHLLWNMIVLYFAGSVVEQRVGHFLYYVIYLFGGVAGGLLYTFIAIHDSASIAAAQIPLVGASGSISGIVGLFFVFAWSRNINLYWAFGTVFGKGWDQLEIPAGLMVLIWLAQNVFGAVSTLVGHGDGVAYFAHLGGFVFGCLFGYSIGLFLRPGKPEIEMIKKVSPSKTDPMLALLERALSDGDKEKAHALYDKCRTIGVTIPASTIASLEKLERNG